MDRNYEGWKEMGIELPPSKSWKWIWWRYTANTLLNLIIELRNEIAGQNGLIYDMKIDLLTAKQESTEWKERASTENRDAAIAVQVIKERMRSGDTMPCVLNNRELAAKRRIQELERENSVLRQSNKDLANKLEIAVRNSVHHGPY